MSGVRGGVVRNGRMQHSSGRCLNQEIQRILLPAAICVTQGPGVKAQVRIVYSESQSLDALFQVKIKVHRFRDQ